MLKGMHEREEKEKSLDEKCVIKCLLHMCRIIVVVTTLC